jgi:hypothetical protein
MLYLQLQCQSHCSLKNYIKITSATRYNAVVSTRIRSHKLTSALKRLNHGLALRCSDVCFF